MMLRFVVLAAALALAAPAWGQACSGTAAGATCPSQKLVFADPLSGKTVWRMTTSGLNRMGDQTQESHGFSPDSTRAVYQKSGATGRPDGVYTVDLVTGVETLVVPGTSWNSVPIFSRDGTEVYYFQRPATSSVRVMAAKAAAPWTVRTVATITSTWQEKLAVNANGTRLSATVRLTGDDSTWHVIILDPRTGALLPGWETTGPAGDDGASWHPSNPDVICASRNGKGKEKVWTVTNTAAPTGASCQSAHAGWHPNGQWYMVQGYLTNATTGSAVIPGTGVYPIHPFFNPTEGALGTEATMLSDDRDWFSNNTGRPRLYRVRASQLAKGDYRPPAGLLAVHYGKMSSNTAHLHPQWSPNGQYVLWQSDLQDLRDGTPPGGTSGQQAIFVMPLAVTPPPPTTYALTLGTVGAGQGQTAASGTSPYAEGAQITLTATPAAGSTFDAWGPLPCAPVFYMPAAALTCVATFALVPTYPVTVATAGTGAGAAAVTGGPSFPADAPVTLTAAPAAGSTFTGWTPAPCAPTFTMPAAPVACTATFTLNAPPPPLGVTLGDGARVLSWQAVPGATGYTVERNVDGGAWEPVQDVTGTSLKLNPPALCYRVKATNPGGPGTPSTTEVCW